MLLCFAQNQHKCNSLVCSEWLLRITVTCTVRIMNRNTLQSSISNCIPYANFMVYWPLILHLRPFYILILSAIQFSSDMFLIDFHSWKYFFIFNVNHDSFWLSTVCVCVAIMVEWTLFLMIIWIIHYTMLLKDGKEQNLRSVERGVAHK